MRSKQENKMEINLCKKSYNVEVQSSLLNTIINESNTLLNEPNTKHNNTLKTYFK